MEVTTGVLSKRNKSNFVADILTYLGSYGGYYYYRSPDKITLRTCVSLKEP